MTQALFHVETPKREARSGLLERWAQALVRSRLERIREGSLRVVEGGTSLGFGPAQGLPRATIHVTDPSIFWRAVALRGALGGAEAYAQGAWRSDDLPAVIRILARNRKVLAALDGGFARLVHPGLAALHRLRRNTRAGSLRNIAAHYDLGNEFFALLLDPTLTYSCGIFEHDETSLEEASRAKYDRLCRKLRLGPADHVLEIGAGWGGFALHAASRYGCRVTTTSISRQQVELARRRVAEAGLCGRVEVLCEDYRDLRGHYDKLVSIEMVEAVGHENLGEFFRVCGSRLRPDGIMGLQAITVADRDFESSKRSVDFIKRYIFPGGQLVSVSALCTAAAASSDLQLRHLEDLTPHYARTLRQWRRRMLDNVDRVRALGHGEAFLRMWDYYFAYCEGGFEERQIGVIQGVFERADARRPSLLGALG